jgi:glycosyltransferase involved in cell wall biosynthesis
MNQRTGRLRIAQVAPAATPVTPGQGDSVEQLVSLLTEGLLARGHEVTLYATGDSRTQARLRAVHEHGYDVEHQAWDWYRAEAFHAAQPFEHAGEHDLIHAHDFHFTLPFSRLSATPLIETAHTEIPPEVLSELGAREDVHLVLVSDYQRGAVGPRPNVSVIPHGIDFDSFPLGTRPEGYLLFLGRMIADKGPADAVRIAQAAGMPLVLAGPAEDGYCVDREIPIDGERVRWVGRVDARERNRLLAGATALLFPLVYPEPFGLVMVEAMACGAPVLATRMGAAAELIEPGVTGYTAPDWESLATLVGDAAQLDRARIRETARQRYDKELMIDRHEALYREIAERRR